MENARAKKTAVVIANVLLYGFFAVCFTFLVFIIVSQKSSDGAFPIFGKEMRIVVSGSMEASDNTDVTSYDVGSIPLGSLVVIDKIPTDEIRQTAFYRDLKVGDVLTFRYVCALTQDTVTHRIVEIVEEEDGSRTFTLRGDNVDASSVQILNTKRDTPDTFNYVIGKVTSVCTGLGLFVTFLKQPLAMILAIIVPCVIVIMLEIVRIMKYLGEKRIKALRDTSGEEIERLKQLLAKAQADAEQLKGGNT